MIHIKSVPNVKIMSISQSQEKNFLYKDYVMVPYPYMTNEIYKSLLRTMSLVYTKQTMKIVPEWA